MTRMLRIRFFITTCLAPSCKANLAIVLRPIKHPMTMELCSVIRICPKSCT
ncbi:hypothetical protein PF005_g9887 [Phytophthora fragariae]|uniref:Uncharacterized protein n=2 Tax=Phytophthora TaxID=4783 RepID=A0A6A3UX61_9STRA|nr:hypothetical protein PF009_g5376 [Phytophthora fragariae]KAE9007838.1 hypothetical protein PR002_g16081 [Phytophthora rubi]KAE9012641.1 hypothetical protein PR001_g15607 [Phytophthora rubi]KAE9151487.1 hypothetical protein PF006_g4232 [Phytophthora fragariae]KAE9214283.1 hypothetical protein PF005_g9887 [Phytophthora fragariae]